MSLIEDLTVEETGIKDDYLEKIIALSLKTQEEVCRETGRIDGQLFQYFDESADSPDGRYHSRFRVGLLEDSRLFEKASFVVSENWGTFTKETEKSAREVSSEKEHRFCAAGAFEQKWGHLYEKGP